MTELAKCPFCGGEAHIVEQDVEPQNDYYYSGRTERFVQCDGCGACMFDKYFHEGFGDDDVAARAAWNRRAEGWVPVGEGLPEPEMSELVLIWDDYAKEWALAWYGLETEERYDEDGDELDEPQKPHWHGDDGEDLAILEPTHWRKLPELPEKEETK